MAASRAGRIVLAAGLALALAGCAWLPRAARVPMRTLPYPAACPARPYTLLVMLPGAYSFPEDFVRQGFVDAVRVRGIAADLMLVDAHLAYYERRTILERLEADVVRPARAAGYRHVWFAGISVGAFGSMLYADTHPGEVAGIVAIGPYLGERPLVAEIAAAGGLAAWRPADNGRDAIGATEVWRWLQRLTSASVETRPELPLLVGYGVDDRFALGQRLLADALPPDRVATAPGGHDWKPWRQTWSRLLDRAPLPRDPACRGDAVKDR